MDSFMIKYDIDDLLMNNKENNSTSTNCICKRLATIFSDLLTKPNQSCDETSNHTTNCPNNDIKEIYTELKHIRNYQSDLSDKFNLVMNSLSQNNNTNNNNNNSHIFNNKRSAFQLTNRQVYQSQEANNNCDSDRYERNGQYFVDERPMQRSSNNTSNSLTGAKKRKNKLATKTEIDLNEQDFHSQGDDEGLKDLEETAELEDEHILNLIEEDIELETEHLMQNTNVHSPVKLIERDFSSPMSSATSSSKHSIPKKANSDESKSFEELQVNYNGQKVENQSENISCFDVEALAKNNEERNKHLDDEFSQEFEGDNDNNSLENSYEFTIDQDENLAARESLRTLIRNNSACNNYKQPMYKFNAPPPNSRCGNQKLRASPIDHMIIPSNKKPRLMNQSSTPQPTNHNYYSNQQALAKCSPSLNSRSVVKNNNYSPFSNNNNLNESDSKFKPNQNTSKLNSNGDTHSNKSEPPAEIDINELLKNGGPRFLQMELYKDFKPPVVLIDDKWYIDNMLASAAYSKSKSRRNFAAHLAKLVFTPRERLESNCNGRFGKKALDTTLLMSIRNTLFKFYPCQQSSVYSNHDAISSGEYDENNIWLRDCIPAIDESNRVLKKQLIAWYKKNKHHTPGPKSIEIKPIYTNYPSKNTLPIVKQSNNYSIDHYQITGGGVNNEGNEDYDTGNSQIIDEENDEDFEF